MHMSMCKEIRKILQDVVQYLHMILSLDYRYLPPIAEHTINKKEVSFCPKEERKGIFKGKKFFFLTQKQVTNSLAKA